MEQPTDMHRQLAKLEACYQRLRDDVRDTRNEIGDTPMASAGFRAVTMLEKLLARHPIAPQKELKS
jgi:hypothetical protein